MAAEIRDWPALVEQYSIDYEAEQISPADWCERNGLTYGTAKRYISVKAAKKACELRNSRAKKAKPGRTEKGHFVKGHRIPECLNKGLEHLIKFEAGNQAARKHGGYAVYQREEDLAVSYEAEIDGLIAERRMFRARITSALRTIQEAEDELLMGDLEEDKEIALRRLIRQAENSIERSATRVESLTRTLSAIRIDDVNEPKIIADTDRIKSARRKLDAETARLERDQGGDTTPLDEIVEDLQQMGSGGLMS